MDNSVTPGFLDAPREDMTVIPEQGFELFKGKAKEKQPCVLP